LRGSVIIVIRAPILWTGLERKLCRQRSAYHHGPELSRGFAFFAGMEESNAHNLPFLISDDDIIIGQLGVVGMAGLL